MLVQSAVKRVVKLMVKRRSNEREGGGAWTTGAAPPTARMAPVPGGRMAPNWLTPNMPRLETVKVPDENSAGLSLPALACGLGGARVVTTSSSS